MIYCDYRIEVKDGTIVLRNNFPSPSNSVTFLDGPSCDPVNSTIELLGLSNTANAYRVVYLDSGGHANGHFEFAVHSYALSTTLHP